MARLVRQAQASENHHPVYGAVRSAFIEWILEHLHPDGRHILRPSRPGETMFRPDGRGELRQYRALLTMCDDTFIVDHPRLRAGDIAALPAGLGLLHRLRLASVPSRRNERDAGLWARGHRETHPDCKDWTILGTD
jgi:hypothetical protein